MIVKDAVNIRSSVLRFTFTTSQKQSRLWYVKPFSWRLRYSSHFQLYLNMLAMHSSLLNVSNIIIDQWFSPQLNIAIQFCAVMLTQTEVTQIFTDTHTQLTASPNWLPIQKIGHGAIYQFCQWNQSQLQDQRDLQKAKWSCGLGVPRKLHIDWRHTTDEKMLVRFWWWEC